MTNVERPNVNMQETAIRDTPVNGESCLENDGFSDIRLMFTAIAGVSTYRAKRNSESFFVKVASLLDENSILRLRGEWNLLSMLKSERVPGAYQPLSWTVHGEVAGMIFRDTGKFALKELYQKPLSTDSEWKLFLERIRSICLTLETCHALDIRHGNIRPEVILVDLYKDVSEIGAVQLTSWLFSSRLPIEFSFPSAAILSTSLSYVAPECTGRMNRSTDFRSDLYSLGVTMYQLVCGRLPFSGSSTLEIMHKHISENVPAPSKFCDIPQPLELLIMRLLKKAPEDRYQSVTGLLHDIDLLLDSLSHPAKSIMSAIEIGKKDHASRFVVSTDLVGREREISALLNLFDGLKKDSRARVATIGGYSGVGKSRLVKEVIQVVSQSNVFYTECKFDQYKGFAPFSTMKILVSDLLSQIFVETPVVLANWREKIVEALGDEARPVCDLCPDLVSLLKTDYMDLLPPVVPLGALASEERLKRGLRRLIQVFASKEHQLIMFVDDAQWSPPADLEMLLGLKDQLDTFIICAYRDNEVGANHLLNTIFLSNVEPDISLTVAALDLEYTTRLIASTLHRPLQLRSLDNTMDQEIRELAELIHVRTQGNCFFIAQVLTTLHREGCFSFDFDSGTWTWRLDEIRSHELSDDVVDLVIRQVTNLTPACQEILKTASCLGNSSFRLDILEISTQLSKHEIAQELFGAMSAGLVLAVSDNYKAALALDTSEQWVAARTTAMARSELALGKHDQGSGLRKVLGADLRVSYAFLHDRVQQAVYALVTDQERSTLHLCIGTRLLSAYDNLADGAIRFDICNQVNRGKSLVEGPDRLRFARLNLEAARSAFENTANDSALELLNHAAEFLPLDPWVVSPSLAEEYYELKEEVLASITDYDGALQASKIILERTDDKVTKIRMYSKQIKALLSKNDVQDALGVAAVALSVVDIDFGRFLDGSASDTDIANETSHLWKLMPSSQESIVALKDLPRLTEKAALAASDLLVAIFPPVYFLAPPLVELLILTAVNTSIQRGVAGYSCYYFTFLGLLLCEVDIGRCAFALADAWNETGEILLGELMRNDSRMLERASATLTLTGCCHGFTRDSRVDGRRVFNTAINLGLRCFDGEYIAYALGNSAVGRLHAGESLRNLYSELRKHIRVVESYKRDLGSLYAFPTLQCMSNLLFARELGDLVILSGKLLGDETIALQKMQTGGMGLHQGYYWLSKLLLSVISKNTVVALEAVREGRICRKGAAGVPAKTFTELLSALILFDLVHETETPLEDDLKDYLAEIGRHIAVWGSQNPRNFGAWIHIWDAESNRGLASLAATLEHYNAAIDNASASNNFMLLGLFNERCARFLMRQPKGSRIAHGYLIEAVTAYTNWGCRVKAQSINLEFSLKDMIDTLSSLSDPEPVLSHRRDSVSTLSAIQTSSGSLDTTTQPGLTQVGSNSLQKPKGEATYTPNPNIGIEGSAQLDLAMVVRNSLLLSKAFHASDIVPQLLKHLLQVAGAQFAALIVEDKTQKFLLSATAHADDVRLYDNLCLEQAEDLVPTELVRLAANLKRAIIDEHKHMRHRRHDEWSSASGHQMKAMPKSFVVLPVLLSDRVVAVAYLSNDQVSQLFSERKVELLTILVTQAAVSLEKVYMYTELKIANDRLENHAEQLEATVEERTAQLRIKNETLSAEIMRRTEIEEQLVHAREVAETATAMKSRFLATMSHELRTPFNAVIGFSTLLLDTQLDLEQRDLAQSIVDASTDLVAVINDILDFSKIESDKMNLDPIWFDLRALVESTLEIVAQSAGSKEIDLGYLEDNKNAAAWIFADNTRLRQCVLNLLSNAIKFTPENGSVSIESRLETVGEALENGDHPALLEISVQDSGIGIAEEDHGKLFRFFSQVDDSTTRQFGGTGLGLAISKRICTLFSGDLVVESELGKGALFTASFRVMINRKEHPIEPLESVTLKQKRCLILEPAALLRRSLQQHLEVFGVKSFWRTSIEDLAEHSDRYDFAIIGDSFNQPETIIALRSSNISVDRLALVVLMPFGATMPVQPTQKDLDAIDAVISTPVRRVRLFRSLQSLFPDATGVPQFAKPTTQNLEIITNPANSFARKDISLLLVEDNLVNVKVATQLLKKAGYVPKVCYDGLEAVAACAVEHFDLILMDLSMPRMGGLEATREIRTAQQATQKSFICAMTANAMTGDRERCIDAGMDDYITKPVMRPALHAVLDKVRDIVTGTLEGMARLEDLDLKSQQSTTESENHAVKRRASLTKRLGSSFTGIPSATI